jgi:hypothetical protein
VEDNVKTEDACDAVSDAETYTSDLTEGLTVDLKRTGSSLR